MTIANNHAILLLVAVLLWSVQARGELVKLQVEGRVDKVDGAGPTDQGIKVGATFQFMLNYDTQVKGTFLVSNLKIDTAGHLTRGEAFFCRASHLTKVGDWDRLRLTIKPVKDATVSLDVKLVLLSGTNGDLNPSITRPYYLPLKAMKISLRSEMFFHFIYSHREAPYGLISGEIKSLTEVDG